MPSFHAPLDSLQARRYLRPIPLTAALFIILCGFVAFVLPYTHGWRELMQIKHEPTPPSNQISAPPIILEVTPQQRDQALAHYATGTEHLKLGRYSEAATYYKKAFERLPSFAAAYTGLAEASRLKGDFQAAELNALHAIDQLRAQPANPAPEFDATNALSQAYQTLGLSLLGRARALYAEHDINMGKMEANRAAGYCAEAAGLNPANDDAVSCRHNAAQLAINAKNG